MIFVYTKNGETKKNFPLLFWCFFWIREKQPVSATLICV
jgi:hypothetical protein